MNNRLCIALSISTLAFACEASAGQSSTQPRLITVDGVQVRVWTSGLERHVAGQRVIALEAGSGADLETWKPVFNELGKLGPVMVRLQIKHQMEWTLGSANGIFTIAGHTGHQVHRDDPALVVAIVRHVFERASLKK